MTSLREIHWFSGSGNSRHVAGALAKRLGGATLQKITEAAPPAIEAPELGLVFPVHSFRVPAAVRRWIEQADLSKVTYCWAVLTMGGSGQKAWAELRALLAQRGIAIASMQKIITPDSCLYLYPANSCKGPAVTGPILDRADAALESVADNIQKRLALDPPEKPNAMLGYLLSNLLGGIFLRSLPGAKRPWAASSACGGCGNCAEICPSQNISLELEPATGKRRPVWAKQCVLCMACIEWCPSKAIDYGKATQRRGRYHHRGVTAAQMKGLRQTV